MSESKRLPYIRVSWFMKRKPGTTPQEFHEYWENVHSSFALSIPGFKEKAKRYSQFHTTPEYQEKAKALGVPALDFDGVADMWLENVEDYAQHMTQKEILDRVIEDGSKYAGEGTHVMIGYETLVHGEPVPGLPQDKHFRL